MEIQKTNNLALWAGVAAVLAIAFNVLFFEKYLGISVLVYGVLMLGALFWLCYKNSYSIKPALGLSAVFLFVIALPAFRDNEILVALNVLAGILLYLLMIRVVTKDRLMSFGFLDYILTVIIWPLKFVGGFFKSLSSLLRGARNIPQGKTSRVLMGILAAIPVLIFFGLLFASADLAFRQFMESIFSYNISDEFVGQTVVAILVFMFSLGGFYYLLNPGDKTSDDISELLGLKRSGDLPKEDRSLEVTVFLSLIGALFLLFIGFQVNYFFGGVSNITFGQFTYAEYARKGFWELLVVSLSTLAILLLVDRFTSLLVNRKSWFIWPSLAIILEVLVIMLAAFKRLALYQDAYGLTDLRLYVSAFIIMLAIIFIILAVKFVANKKHSFFAFGVFCSMAGFLITMNLLNPDKFIAEQNIDRFNEIGKIDTPYLLSLSADATPIILKEFKPSTEDDKILLDRYLEEQLSYLENQVEYWQSFSISRQKALTELKNHLN